MCHGQILDNAIRKARKDHVCGSCGRPIRKGIRYARTVQADEGGDGLLTWKDCLTCEAINHEYAMETTDGECWLPGSPREHMRELLKYGHETVQSLLAKLRKARARILE